MTSITIVMPLPPPCVSPNGRYHWATKARATAAVRTEAKVRALAAIGRGRAPRWEQAVAQASFYFKIKRRRDADNMLASTKAVWDGLRDAGVILDDSGLTHLPVVMGVDKTRPRVEITVRAKE